MLWKSVDFPKNLYLCSQNHNPVNMKKEIQPQETSRAEAFKMWMSSPQPMGASPSITVNLQFFYAPMREIV